jgi:sec-independent protein translocase protein TatA
MGITSVSHLLVLLLVIFVVFGAGKLPKVMGDIGRGIKNFRQSLDAEDNAEIEKIEKKL